MKIVRNGNLFVVIDGAGRFVGVGTCIVVDRPNGASVAILYAGTNGPVRAL